MNNYSPFPFPELIQMKANVTNKVIVIEWHISGVSVSSQKLNESAFMSPHFELLL